MHFNITGRYIGTLWETFCACQAMCCSREYILLAGSGVQDDGSYSAVVEVLTWEGDIFWTLSHQELGVDESSDILVIRCNHDWTVMQLVTYNKKNDNYSLHAYKVSDNLS